MSLWRCRLPALAGILLSGLFLLLIAAKKLYAFACLLAVVLNRQEVHSLLCHLRERDRITASLLYGSGSRFCKKYPNAEKEWDRQYIFPASTRPIGPRKGCERRHHLDESVLHMAVELLYEKRVSQNTLAAIRFDTLFQLWSLRRLG